jgi:Zn-dependent protease
MDTITLQRLRGFLRICFGYLTLITTLVSAFLLASLFSAAQHPHAYHYYYRGQKNVLVSAILIALSRIVRFAPVPLAITYGMAWWTLKQGRPSARRWAIAASALMVLSSAIMLISRLTLWPGGRRFHGSFLSFQIFFIAAGILGLFVFWKTSSDVIEAASVSRTRGDGTSTFLDLAVSVLALTGVWGGMLSYARWGHAQQLPFTRGAVSLGIIALVLFLTVTLHEAAHAAAGLALGMKLRAFVIGPFQWRVRDGRWKYLFQPAGILSFGGSTGMVPMNPNQGRWIEIAMIAAGPFSNLCAGALAIWLTLSAKGSPWERFWEPLAFFATVNLVTCAVNLVPFRPEALYSDGARIYQLLSGGPWASLHRAYSTVLSSTVSDMRPSRYDMDAIRRAQAHFKRGREALMLSLFATSHYLDSGDIPEARASFADATRLYQETRLNIPTDLLTSFVFNSVYLDRDAASARRFWNLYESKSPTHFGVDYWLSRSALHWIENHPLEARDAFATGSALADQLPHAGAYDFDRDRYRGMKELLDGPPVPSADDQTEILSEAHAES